MLCGPAEICRYAQTLQFGNRDHPAIYSGGHESVNISFSPECVRTPLCLVCIVRIDIVLPASAPRIQIDPCLNSIIREILEDGEGGHSSSQVLRASCPSGPVTVTVLSRPQYRHGHDPSNVTVTVQSLSLSSHGLSNVTVTVQSRSSDSEVPTDDGHRRPPGTRG
jgi:hypothetical protein